MENKIILIGGYCATGKSTFARKLSNRNGLPCFLKDTIKEVIGEGFGKENVDVHHKNSMVTFSLMLHIAERFLQAKKVCILESNFKKAESYQIEELLERYDCECLTFIFIGDLDVVYDRYVGRDRSGERHWVHTAASEDRNGFKKGHLQAGLGDVALGQTVVVDTSVFENVDYEELFAIADDFLSGERNSF